MTDKKRSSEVDQQGFKDMALRCILGLAAAFFLATSDPSGATSRDNLSDAGDLPLENDTQLEELLEEPYEVRFEGGV